MKRRKSIFKRLALSLIAGALAVVTLGLPFLTASPKTVSAETTTYVEGENDFDRTPVVTDLGEDFVKQYEGATSGELMLQSFQEYCYSNKPTILNTKFGLYIYVYNPSRLEFASATSWDSNTANMAVSYNSKGEPDGYAKLRLKNCGCTTGKYDKLFYKFRVLGLEEVVANAQACDSKSGYRRYDLAEIQLRTVGSQNATAYEIARTFTFTGYSEGCGSEEESTLECKQTEMDVLSLSVHHTSYRPEGNNGKNEYTQDSLNSVWFSVPNEMIEKYGEMYAVHATWLEAVLKPALVTGNLTAYNAIKEYLGVYLDGHNEDLPYFYGGAYTRNTPAPDLEITDLDRVTDFLGSSYNAPEYWLEDNNFWQLVMHGMLHTKAGYLVDPLYLMFYAGDGVDSADDCIVSSAEIQKAVADSSLSYGGALVNGKYSNVIFSSVSDTWFDGNITRDETTTLLSKTKVDQNFLEKLFGTTEYVSDAIENEDIYAIHEVTASDLSGNAATVSDRLYISQSDYDDLMSDYATAQKNGETVYLFRFDVSDYFGQEATLFYKTDKNCWLNDDYYWEEVDTNARFFYETVYLDFEIIDVTFKKDEIKTVIPVVMSPIDIFPESTPAIDTESDADTDWWEDLWAQWKEWWAEVKRVLAIAGGVIVAVVVVVVIVAIVSKARNNHMRNEIYKNTKPRSGKKK